MSAHAIAARTDEALKTWEPETIPECLCKDCVHYIKFDDFSPLGQCYRLTDVLDVQPDWSCEFAQRWE